MAIHRVLASLPRYDPVLLVAVVGSALTVFAADVLLLDRKYDVFRGGFLQAHPIVGVSNAIPFLVVVLLFELLYFFAWAGAWGAVCRRLQIGPRLAAYHFLGAVAGLNLVVIAARYQIFSYFSDFMDFTVMKNLVGGSLSAAIAYGLEEGRLYGLVVSAAFCVYVAGHLYFARRLGPASHRDLRGTTSSYAATCGVCVVGLALLVLAVNQSDDYRTHLNRMTAYSSPRDLFDTITDFDRDGYGLFGWWPDPAPFDPSVYPNALDIPGDGIDQDGLAGDFEYRPRPTLNAVFPARQPHLIVVVLESARADVIDAEVGGQPVVPVIRRLADQGSVARAYYSHTGFTTSSLKAIFAGTLSGLPRFGESLFTLLKQHGYQVAVVSGQDESLGSIAGDLKMREASKWFFDATFARSARVFSSAAPTSLTLSNDRVVQDFERLVGNLDWKKPAFVYVNLQSGHFPYYYPGMPVVLPGVTPLPRSAIGASRKRELLHTYLNAIAVADAALGRIMEILEARGVLDDTLLVVSGDHGESLFDDGLLGHGHQLNDKQTRTLLVANRRLAGLDGLLGQIDLSSELLRGLGAQLVDAGSGIPVPPGVAPDQVFQIVGGLDRPTLIGFVDRDGKRVMLNMGSREAYIPTRERWVPLAKLRDGDAGAEDVKRLIRYWEQLRWERHLALSAVPPRLAQGNQPAAQRAGR